MGCRQLLLSWNAVAESQTLLAVQSVDTTTRQRLATTRLPSDPDSLSSSASSLLKFALTIAVPAVDTAIHSRCLDCIGDRFKFRGFSRLRRRTHHLRLTQSARPKAVVMPMPESADTTSICGRGRWCKSWPRPYGDPGDGPACGDGESSCRPPSRPER